MRAKIIPGSLLLGVAILLVNGCAAPLAGSRDSSLAGSEGDTSSLFNAEQLSKRLKNSAKTAIGKGYSPDKARELYTDAEQRYLAATQSENGDQRDELLSAAEDFRKSAERWPDSALEQDALFMAGEAYFFADHYPKANDSYELVLKKFPNSKHLDTIEARRFAIADYWLKLNDIDRQSFWEFNFTDERRPVRDAFGHAVRVFDRIRVDDPTGKLADDATLAAGNAYFTSGRFLDADSFYADLRKTFPSSEHQFRAHLLGVKAKLLSYQGPDYSGDPLDEAEKLIKQIRRQFPREAEEEREYLSRAYAEVRFQKAEREWHMARYYDRRGENGAARFYYDVVARDYTQTPFAQRAEERLAQIGGEPDVPPQRLGWLVDLFPGQEDVRPLMATAPDTTTRR
ncbi:MAG: outer membrane protein assembly factor BamD [Planctomycetes bacterium]|nr:outer membrane protein assembly factor BamD [Planctomycetota bacterium]